MNKLLTTALVSAILAAPSFAQTKAQEALAITSASVSGLQSSPVGVADSGNLYVLGNANITTSQKLSLGKGVTVNMGVGTALYDGNTINPTPDASPQSAVTLTNNGTIVIDATDLANPIKMGKIVDGSTVQQGIGSKIILNVESTIDKVTYTPPSSSPSYSLGAAYTGNVLTQYQTAIENTGLKGLYTSGSGTIKDLESSSTPESLKIGDIDMLELDKISLDALPKINHTSQQGDFVTALRANTTGDTTFTKYGILFSTDGGSSSVPTTCNTPTSSSSAISALTGVAAQNLVVLPAAATITCGSGSDSIINCDLTNYTGTAYTSDVKFDGSGNLTLSGNVSELKNVTVDCPLKITGATCPSGKITNNITFTSASGTKITADYLDLSSSGTVTITTGTTLEANYVVM